MFVLRIQSQRHHMPGIDGLSIRGGKVERCNLILCKDVKLNRSGRILED